MQYVGYGSVWKDVATTSWPITIPGTVQAGDFGILVVCFDSVTANTTTVTGWTQIATQFNSGTMSSQVFTKAFVAGDTTVAITTSPGQIGSATAFWLRGVTGINQTGTYGIRSGSIFTVVAPGITTTETRSVIALFADRTTMTTAGEYDAINSLSWGTVLAKGDNNPALGASSGIPAQWLVGYDQLTVGATGDNTATMQDSSGNAWGVVMALDPPLVASTAIRSVDAFEVAVANSGVAVRSLDAFESVVATSGQVIRSLDSFESVVATSGQVTRNVDVFEVVVASSSTLTTSTNDLWVWNGTTEIPANVTVWNGTSEVPASVSIT